MNVRMGIPDRFNCIRKEDIPLMATWAAQEANPVYPVPVIYDEARFARSSSVHTTANNLVSILAILLRRRLV